MKAGGGSCLVCAKIAYLADNKGQNDERDCTNEPVTPSESYRSVDFQEDEHDYQFKVEYPEPTCCHACGAVSDIIRFNKKLVKYRDVPMHRKRVTLWVVTRRYQCKSCKGTFTPAIPEMAEAHRMTKRCYQYIIKRCADRH